MYCYIYTGRGAEYCYSVGFTSSSGSWTHESYHGTTDEAARRVHYLNGGNGHPYDWPKTKESKCKTCGASVPAGFVFCDNDGCNC
jgi:hypothetical protein